MIPPLYQSIEALENFVIILRNKRADTQKEVFNIIVMNLFSLTATENT